MNKKYLSDTLKTRTKKHPTHLKQPVYQDFSVNIGTKQLKKHSGHNVALRWDLPQNTAGQNLLDVQCLCKS